MGAMFGASRLITPTRSFAATSPLKGEVKRHQKKPSAFGLWLTSMFLVC